MHARDFAWFADEFPSLDVAYCLTLIRGVDPDDALTRFGVTGPRVTAASIVELETYAAEGWDRSQPAMFVAATTVDGWSLLIEPNGFLGATDTVVEQASETTELVSVFRNVNALGRFCWVVDGKAKVIFDPLFCQDRSGSEPEVLRGPMTEAGFLLSPTGDHDEVPEHTNGAALALAANLTGIRLSAAVLNTATYRAGWVGGSSA